MAWKVFWRNGGGVGQGGADQSQAGAQPSDTAGQQSGEIGIADVGRHGTQAVTMSVLSAGWSYSRCTSAARRVSTARWLT